MVFTGQSLCFRRPSRWSQISRLPTHVWLKRMFELHISAGPDLAQRPSKRRVVMHGLRLPWIRKMHSPWTPWRAPTCTWGNLTKRRRLQRVPWQSTHPFRLPTEHCANALAFAGKAEEAIAVFEGCRQLSPRDPDRSGVLMGFASALFVAARYEEAIEAARKHLELRPNWYGTQILLAVCSAHLGRMDDARKAAIEVVRQVPHFSLEGARRRPLFKRRE